MNCRCNIPGEHVGGSTSCKECGGPWDTAILGGEEFVVVDRVSVVEGCLVVHSTSNELDGIFRNWPLV